MIEHLEELKKNIVRSGGITPGDIRQLRDIVYTDGKVNDEEANFLFALKKEMGTVVSLPAWEDFFVKAICDYVLEDDRSPKTVDEREARWLVEMIGEDSKIDDVEERLLKEIKAKAKHFPDNLQEIQKHTSISKRLGKAILRILCGNTMTARSFQMGMSKTGERKPNPFYIKSSDDDEDH